MPQVQVNDVLRRRLILRKPGEMNVHRAFRVLDYNISIHLAPHTMETAHA